MQRKTFFVAIASIFALSVIGVAIFLFGMQYNGPKNDIAMPVFSRIATGPLCTKQRGHASSCAENGFRILRISDLQLQIGEATGMLYIALPPGTQNIIGPSAYYWSIRTKAWQPIALTGDAYAAGSPWLKDRAAARLHIPTSEIARGENFIITWDYTNNASRGWIGPACVAPGSTGLNNCWRLVTFTAQ